MPEHPAASIRELAVRSEGVTLAVWEGPDNGPTVLLVHGFPDTHVVWDPVVDRLLPRFHCVTYDVRGAGASDRPGTRDSYVARRLVTDLVAVMNAFSPGRPVHLVGPDWGSIQAWEAVVREGSDSRLTGRIASYTTISGPCLDHFGRWARGAIRGTRHDKRAALEQALRSWYVLAFQVPVLPELLLRHLNRVTPRRRRGAVRGHFAETLPEDAAYGANLYRANRRGRQPVAGGRRTTVPVQLIVPTRDKYLTPAIYEGLDGYALDLARVELDAGHWVQLSHPDEVADLIATFALAHES
ncbi:MAG: alpha/beta fold hydrolase [Nocardioidaceae bacterium]